MGSYARKLERNKLKKELGTNKIKDFWHQQHDSLEQRLIAGMKRARENKK